ncbi:dynamin family protein [Dactylosporangium sp. CS-047395]|uniref:dynamin family protein n=1 Tax=Dactylosporangium sp. CS-047395 TaxID=3239936 RepID=UPI003D908413
MTETLERRLADAFAEADRILAPGAERTRLLRQALGAIRERSRALMSVAVVGRVSSGKSTLVNALIGEQRVATGSQELTYNVNRLRYGTKPGLMVHYKDDRPPVPYSLEALESLTARREEHMEQLQGIREVVVETTAKYLRSFELIDTPGLDAVFGDDSLNTLEFLRMVPGEIRTSTLQHASTADALLLVVGIRGPAEADTQLLDNFLGGERADATPLNALGVLTKCEHRWRYGEAHPLVIGRQLADRTLREAPNMHRRLYDLTPVCSLVGLGASVLDGPTLEQLRELAALPPERLRGRLVMADRFTAGNAELPLEPAERRRLWDQFAAYGLFAATTAIRAGIDTLEPLRAHLLADSGMEDLRAKLVDHFGHRAALLKFHAATERIGRMPHKLAAGLGPRERTALDEAIGVFTGLSLNEPGIDQLTVLRNLYTGRLSPGSDEEAEEVRRVLGEFGRRPCDRLGAPPDTPPERLQQLARERHAWWSVHWMSGILYGPDREAARIVVRAYEYLIHELNAVSPW